MADSDRVSAYGALSQETIAVIAPPPPRERSSKEILAQQRQRTVPREWWPWWWWEIGGLAFSLLCCIALVGFLWHLDQKPQQIWKHRLEPNTVLAIISTFVKTAMMVPVVSCISQLKWHHFASKPSSLSYLDIMDRCSRGPWGSFAFLLQSSKTNVIVSALAIVTILVLGVDPSIQQILETGTREIESRNETGQVSMANEYKSFSIQSGNFKTQYLSRHKIN
jgi:hypothetical protein